MDANIKINEIVVPLFGTIGLRRTFFWRNMEVAEVVLTTITSLIPFFVVVLRLDATVTTWCGAASSTITSLATTNLMVNIGKTASLDTRLGGKAKSKTEIKDSRGSWMSGSGTVDSLQCTILHRLFMEPWHVARRERDVILHVIRIIKALEHKPYQICCGIGFAQH